MLHKKLGMSLNKRLDALEVAQGDAAKLLDLELRAGLAKLSQDLSKDLRIARTDDLRREEDGLALKAAAVDDATVPFSLLPSAAAVAAADDALSLSLSLSCSLFPRRYRRRSKSLKRLRRRSML